MFVPATQLVRRWRQPRSRSEELRALRRRLAAAAREPAGADEIAAAKRLRRLRVELAAAFDAVRSCGTCARGRAEAIGGYDGGYCCGTRTGAVFADHEVAALAFAGTRPTDLRPPRSKHAGCCFRGERGCTLAPENRPNLCVRFVCTELARELGRQNALSRVGALADEIERTLAELAARRSQRIADAEWATLVPEPAPR